MQDEEKFFKDYAESHKKLSELGFSPSSSYFGLKANYVQSAVGLLLAVAAPVLLAAELYTYLFQGRT